jgi:hypothetical protein
LIVEKGEVTAFDDNNNAKFKFSKGDYFGEIPIIYKDKV